MSRKNYSIYDIKKYQNKFIHIFIPIFIITTFRVDFSVDGAIFGMVLSTSPSFLIINFLILGIVTLIFFLYAESHESVRINYSEQLVKSHTQVVCAYPDDSFGDKVYEVDKSNMRPYGHIHLANGNIYTFSDWRTFKFVGVRESRKLKLEHLRNITN